ncbi:MAG TPA: butyryl-CoA:acetate CoA-transferase [Candidatus Hydrogenedentes bacterium]|nr:butyryl-CoA:acetate CoA-transferase [Candidatus Hydrogenedentota bacterium]
MSSVMEEYRRKLISAEDAAAMIQSNQIVDYYAFNASSRYVDAALAKRVGDLENVVIRSELRLAPPMEVFMADPEGRTFRLHSLFRGPIENLVPPEHSTSIPARLGSYEALFWAGELRSDFAAFMVSPPDKDGYLHFWPSPALALADVRASGVFFAEINETYRHFRYPTEECRVHISEVNYIIEGDNPPIFPVPSPPISETDQHIAEHILGELCDGACLQIGYGSVPNAVANLIVHSDLKDLGVQTELIPEGIMELYKAGKITGRRKGVDKGKMTASFVIGGSDLLSFVNDCADLMMCSSSYTNNPHIIGQNENFVAINGCLQIDLTGQVNSESLHGLTYTGTGGQLDFVLGAAISKNGKSILCTPSTYTTKEGEVKSRIVSALAPGTIVTTPRSCVHYIVTEHGIVNLRGRSEQERAHLLIGIAHPDFRGDLLRQAKERKLIW